MLHSCTTDIAPVTGLESPEGLLDDAAHFQSIIDEKDYALNRLRLSGCLVH
jgi:hypothetical protein